jgi:hypothetical protein
MFSPRLFAARTFAPRTFVRFVLVEVEPLPPGKPQAHGKVDQPQAHGKEH